MHDQKKNVIRFDKLVFLFPKALGPVWYVCLKTENCCLKTFVEIRVGKKMY